MYTFKIQYLRPRVPLWFAFGSLMIAVLSCERQDIEGE